MDSYVLNSWLQAIVRWIHVFSAILWIGQTYLFHFFERNLRRDQGEEAEGDLWMVHGGGFFHLEKHRFRAPFPSPLHWFKWEAASTWLSGVALIVLTYYLGGLLVEPEQSYGLAVAVGVGSVVLGWLAYDLLVLSPLGRLGIPFAALGLGLLLAIHLGLGEALSARAAWIHIGAVMGTIMTANVWMRILPAQRKMLEASRAGQPIDPALAAVGPQRSKHNSFMVVPLIFLMLGNHYPIITYGHSHSTLVLGAILVVGMLVAKLLQR